jgi:uncharacterized membrane protein YccF (DUF307 family)
MGAVGNLVWWFSGGLIGAMIWAFAALLFCWTPYAMSFLQMARLYIAPFGKEIVSLEEIAQAKKFAKGIPDEATEPQSKSDEWSKRLGLAFNVLWIPVGVTLALLAVAHAVLLTVTVVGIPLAAQSMKIASMSLWPIGKRVVDKQYAALIRETLAKQRLHA